MPTWVDKILNSQSVQLGLAAVAFLIALLLVIVIARMLMGGRLRLPGSRARQARLGIVDAFDLDRQRQLIIVRRDNTEHLIMIGGPNDLVIESEIVRVEARDFRDRREKTFEGAADARIPARIGTPNGDGQVAAEATPARADEPLLPLDLAPGAPSIDGPNSTPARGAPAMEPPARGPTFPLPPRRPVPGPERRPPPPLPDRVSRTDDSPPPAAVAGVPAPVSPPLQPPTVPPALPAASPADAPVAPAPDAGTRPLAPRPSILKPMPPRPPIRPLKRTTPQADGPSPSVAAREEPTAPPLPTAPEAASAPPPAPPRAPSPQPPKPERPPAPPADLDRAPPAAAAPEADALESLEEEMAKLLGRG